ncbi:hypothetical protein NLJ89_g1010 [Agrocybe chaxingu]|uniref:HMA domain-containing protein n=1 Tax=Agrocybe chaxingu TaxID=84603 RepID=A0A9W8N0V8_9AGAR|nr:hypothetical protein NLJ89_g1010 [Agrocybe chaxingu]
MTLTTPYEPSRFRKDQLLLVKLGEADLIQYPDLIFSATYASVTDPGNLHAEGGEKNIGLINGEQSKWFYRPMTIAHFSNIGIALVVGLQIGSGIFSSPGMVVANTHSVGASLTVWLASGLLAWTGASSFAELGSAIPQNGGAQAYLSYAYGPLVSYLFAWTAIIALKPGWSYLQFLVMFFHATRAEVSPDDIPQWAIKLTAIGAVVVVTILCVAAKKLGTRVAVVFTVVKVTSLILVTVLGIVQLARGKASSSFREPFFSGSSTSPSSYSLAFYSGLWAFDGWDQANYVGGEMSQPEKNIPRAIHSSMFIVTLLFMLANISYFVVLDKNLVGLSNTVAMDFGRALFGPIGGSIFAFMVAFSCFGALNGSFFTSATLVYAAGRERYLPRIFGKLHTTRRTPLNAALLQASITILFIMLGSGFRSLINFSVVASWAFYFLTVLGLVILRVKEPMLERPYRTWIITPLTFCGVALFLLCMPIIAAPVEAAAVLGFILVGIPVYYLTQAADDEDQSRVSMWFKGVVNRLRGRSRAADGWEAVIKQLSPNSLAQNHNYYPRLTASFSVRMSDEHTYKFDVKMTCSGCSGAITRVLEKAKNDGTSGVSSYDVSLENQEVLVTGTIPYDDLLEKIKKTGKEVRSGVTVS